jgi:hypothetical protein
MQKGHGHAAWTGACSMDMDTQHRSPGHVAWTLVFQGKLMKGPKISCYPPLKSIAYLLKIQFVLFRVIFRRNFAETKRNTIPGKRNFVLSRIEKLYFWVILAYFWQTLAVRPWVNSMVRRSFRFEAKRCETAGKYFHFEAKKDFFASFRIKQNPKFHMRNETIRYQKNTERKRYEAKTCRRQLQHKIWESVERW